VTCAKMSKVPKSARCRKIGTREMTGMDWSVFAPFELRIMSLLRDGQSRSTREVQNALGARSNCHIRDTLNHLANKGEIERFQAKRDRHHVDCYRLAQRRTARLVPRRVPAQRR